MKILGLQKTTLLDYPGKLAATIFLAGCNMRCPFCHNMNIVEDVSYEDSFSENQVLDFLNKRLGILEGVCITGGEPTLSLDLPDFIMKIKSLGLCVKLDTNGTNPNMIKNLIDNKVIDYIAMDIKSSLSDYSKVCNVPNINTNIIKESIEIIKSSPIDYEFRTTIISQYHNTSVIKEIGLLLNGANNYFLQSFSDSQYVPNHDLTACSKNTLLSYVDILNNYINHVEIRGID